MESIIVIVGFLGVGKTTFLKQVIKGSLSLQYNPFIILNDYENAYLDAQDFIKYLDPKTVKALSGSCICCSGIGELRQQVNNIPKRENAITLIEANGTTDAVNLMEFLAVGMDERFNPPIQVGIVDVQNWQKRGHDNELEANQVQVSSLIILNFVKDVPIERIVQVEQDLRCLNPLAKIIHWKDFDIKMLNHLPSNHQAAPKLDHMKTHWSSCSVDLPDPISSEHLNKLLSLIPHEILRLKGVTKLDQETSYTYFERVPNGDVFMRPYNGNLVTGPKLLSVGPGSDPKKLSQLIEESGKAH